MYIYIYAGLFFPQLQYVYVSFNLLITKKVKHCVLSILWIKEWWIYNKLCLNIRIREIEAYDHKLSFFFL